MTRISGFSLALFRFSRPHTIVATTFQVGGMFLLAAETAVLPASVWLEWLFTWFGCLAANLYVVGLNQLTDVKIDRINKPTLPLAAGTLSPATVWLLVLGSGLTALGAGVWLSPYLLLTLAPVMLLGTVYSLPPWRLKERPFWAALSIALARGVIANVGVYLHFRTTLAAPLHRLELLGGIAFFFFCFCLVIALFKDIPDWRGDRAYEVSTFAVRLGQERVFWLGCRLLTAAYLLFVAWGATVGAVGPGWFWIGCHTVILALFWRMCRRTKPAEAASMSRFYLLVWGLFYAELVLLGAGSLLT